MDMCMDKILEKKNFFKAAVNQKVAPIYFSA
jgi:hypothetical protein